MCRAVGYGISRVSTAIIALDLCWCGGAELSGLGYLDDAAAAQLGDRVSWQSLRRTGDCGHHVHLQSAQLRQRRRWKYGAQYRPGESRVRFPAGDRAREVAEHCIIEK